MWLHCKTRKNPSPKDLDFQLEGLQLPIQIVCLRFYISLEHQYYILQVVVSKCRNYSFHSFYIYTGILNNLLCHSYDDKKVKTILKVAFEINNIQRPAMIRRNRSCVAGAPAQLLGFPLDSISQFSHLLSLVSKIGPISTSRGVRSQRGFGYKQMLIVFVSQNVLTSLSLITPGPAVPNFPQVNTQPQSEY